MKKEPALQAIGITRPQDHGLAFPDAQDCRAHFCQAGGSRTAGEAAEQVRVGDPRLSRGPQAVGDGQDDMAVAASCVEYAGSVGKAAFLIRHHDYPPGLAIHCTHGDNHLAHLLAVSADILHRRAAHRARNAAQALEPGQILFNAAADKRIPLFACAGCDESAVRFFDAGQGDPDDKAGKARIGNEDIGSAPQDEDLQAVDLRKLEGADHLGFGLSLGQEPCRPADSQ